MKHKVRTPDELNAETPTWFKDWRNREFWHFKTQVEDKLSLHSRILWIVLAAIITIGLIRVLI